MDGFLSEAWAALGGTGDPAVARSGPEVTLPARLPVSAMAEATVGAAGLAAAELAETRGWPRPGVRVDGRAVAVAFAGERHLRIDGRTEPSFAPLSRFWRASDGWVRTHGNYPHHRKRLLRALGLDVSLDDPVPAVREAIAGAPAAEVEEAVYAAGGLAVAVRSAAEWAAHPQGAHVAGLPLLRLTRNGDAPARPFGPPPAGTVLPMAGVRVLDLTRMIAGPVGTRTLALLGADVLRVDSPRLPEIPAQHLETGAGKRSTLLDLDDRHDRARFGELLRDADVVVTGYRPGALDRHGLSPHALAAGHPGLIVASLSAWGATGPWAGRRGFDSLVQAASGIAVAEGDDGPGALPVQALDHGTGYLLAAAVMRAVARRAVEGGGWHAELSLARTAAWLLGGTPAGTAEAAAFDPSPYLVEEGRIVRALPPVDLDGGPRTWADPATPWGSDSPAWRPR
ncbi:CoA transferase [Thermomonospora cellulosilytica]|uniref:Crotonobetainyl-CoA:carnitine CoA-transferase CaiB-like acyl-CoA transferase n=1 Tax=Thermomonospora cellulosilytica TaxID=1411118 RepID=A0A7W3N2Y9_9ACTN|nr:CoA transferase [Thermomonospora cellulosilytica]MBA9006575.1 crotonobetainyl-CoA:carnitine CoA-transferase CaiB-like acyl-CoA transferase [Thermomonospora cellulosilytica]